MLVPGYRVKDFFFDRAPVVKDMDKKTLRTHSRFGLIVMREAKRSLKYGDTASSPGSPPTVHRGKGFTRQKRNRRTGATAPQPVSPLRELIYYGWDPRTRSTVIGPELFRRAKGKGAAEALEKGGEA